MGTIVIIIIAFIIGGALGVFTMCLLQINKKECLHCGGTDVAAYCEKCYQDLISENMKKQNEIKLIQCRVATLENLLGQRKKYINDLEYIRDCYYREIQERKIFKSDYKRDVSESTKNAVIYNEILKYANRVNLYKHEEQWLEKDKEIPIIVYVDEKQYIKLKDLTETFENITYNTEDGIYIE